jgi:hypothetical protein
MAARRNASSVAGYCSCLRTTLIDLEYTITTKLIAESVEIDAEIAEIETLKAKFKALQKDINFHKPADFSLIPATTNNFSTSRARTSSTKSSQNVVKELDRFIELTEGDKEAQEETIKAIEGSTRHVGIVIALKSMANTSEVWVSIYKGFKIATRPSVQARPVCEWDSPY